MAIASVAYFGTRVQDAFKEEGMTKTRSFMLDYASALVREHAKWTEDGYHLCVSSLPRYEKKIFLSHVIDEDFDDPIAAFEDFTRDVHTEDAAFKEYEKSMQYWVDEVIDEVFAEDMSDGGFVFVTDRDHGDSRWIKRY